ncbi:glycoside hydrolase family 15 protein [Halomontanus rarus]|uniref:glycoside hydrolase family 15 protein n=1 Tax=Halomontanus rarus TaxID=3034020 RepID=UPI0023E8BDEB|nr:glycoside hydrolase family 15 protein [Halovivax sp. TS33]
MDYKRIEEYGAIGNGRTVALVGRDGSIDWCCLPHVESPSVFAALLDADRGGRFAVEPAGSYESVQRYVDRTNVLQTQFQTASGRGTVTDFVPVAAAGESDAPTPSAIYRKVACEHGALEFHVEFEPRFDYARDVPLVEVAREEDCDGERTTVVATGDDDRLTLSTSSASAGAVPFRASAHAAEATVSLAAGDERWLVLGDDDRISGAPSAHQRTLEAVVDYWRGWVHECDATSETGAESESNSNCPVGGPWHDLAVRSALVLKLLIHDETGAVAAAPTTSLPEVVGGVRNWDYRYNWIRDAAFTVRALYELDHVEEARSYFRLCLDHCRDHDPADVPPVYGLHGENDLEERVLDHLRGYRDSAPVRVGNAAKNQRQLDVYGELILAIAETIRYGETIEADDWDVMRGMIDYVCEAWDEPDAGIWEVRSDPQHFVYSKLMCWTALDRGIEIAAETEFDAPFDRWRRCRADVREAILDRGFSETANSFVRAFDDEDRLDATSLLVPIVGFLPPDDARVRGTIDATIDRLATDDGLVFRYEGDDGLPGEEGAFVVCSFWLINALALAGRTDEATDYFRDVLDYASPLGLFAQDVDPESGEHRGNFPQAFSHIGLLNSTLYLGALNESNDGIPAPLGRDGSIAGGVSSGRSDE